jgi:glycosyltransferase involved in cell wall biosynthesis
MDLIEAFKLINDQDKEIHLIIAGEFWDDREKYIKRIRDLSLQKTIHIFDHYIPDDEAAQFFEVADIFVAPYTGGTQSGAVKSALGFGMQVIITDIITDDLLSGLPDICTVVPKGSPQSLAEAIREKISKPALAPLITRQIFQESWKSLVKVISNDPNQNGLDADRLP